MKGFCLLIPVLALSIAFAGDTKSELQVKYNEMASATAKGDIKPFDDVLAKDYAYREGGDTEDRDSTLKLMQRRFAQMGNTKWVRTVTRVKQVDGTFVATVQSVMNCDMNVSGQRYHSWNSSVFTDTWVQDSDRHWLLKSSEMVTWDLKVNGKLVAHYPSK